MGSRSRNQARKQAGVLVLALTLGSGPFATARQPSATPSTSAVKPLEGVIDVHAHFIPDVVPRSIDAIDTPRPLRPKAGGVFFTQERSIAAGISYRKSPLFRLQARDQADSTTQASQG
jgi:hypothetical protein